MGFQQKSGEHSLGLTRHWDGTKWTTVASAHPMDYSYVWGVEDISPTDAWAVGESLGGAMVLPFAEHWDGAHWSQVHFSGVGIGKLTAVSGNGPDDVWMIGTRNDSSPFQYARPLVAHWNGTRLGIVHSAKPAKGHAVELTSVTAIGPHDVWAVGSHGGHGQTYLPFLEHWDGTAWSIVGAPSGPHTAVNVESVSMAGATDGFAVGEQTQSASTTPYTIGWDGTAWTH